METKITDNYFEFQNMKYFRGNAIELDLGSYGEKKDPVGSKSYLAEQSVIKPEYLGPKTEYLTTATITWTESQETSASAGGNLLVFGVNLATAQSMNISKTKSVNAKLVGFSINEGGLKYILNERANNARNFLADEGSDGRVVSAIWVWMEGELSSHYQSYAGNSLVAKALGNQLQLTVTGGKLGAQTVNLSAGTTFAYRLHKVSKWENNKTRVADMEDDYKG